MGLVAVTMAPAQDSSATAPDSTGPWYEGAWSKIVERNGLQIGYLFYAEADNHNNGVVLRLRNQNEVAVRYAFTVIFRGPEGTATARAEGTVDARSMITGDDNGLFWIPFEDGRKVAEVGLRGLTVQRLSEGQASSSGPQG